MSHSSYTAADIERIRKEQIRKQIEEEIRRQIRVRQQINNRINSVVKKDAKEITENTFHFFYNIERNNESVLQIDLSDVNVEQTSFVSDKSRFTENENSEIILETVFDREEKKKEYILKTVKEFRESKVLVELSEEKEALLSWIDSCLRQMPDDTEFLSEIMDRIDRFNNKMETYVDDYEDSGYDARKKYLALCDLLGEMTNEQLSDQEIILQNEMLLRALQNKREKEYIRTSMNEVLIELGYEVEDTVALVEDNNSSLDGNLYENSSLKGSRLFVAMDGQEMVLETIADDISKGISESSITESAKTICAHKKAVQQALAERGIIVKIADESIPELKEMYKLSSIKQGEKQTEYDNSRNEAVKIERELTYNE